MTMAICSGAIATASATFNSSNDEREREKKQNNMPSKMAIDEYGSAKKMLAH